MAEGSMAIAIGGGVLAILTAGIPILFLQKEPATKASKLEALEEGIGSMSTTYTRDGKEVTLIDGMEVVDDADTPSDDSPPNQSAKV